MRIGIRAHDLGKATTEEMARKIHDKGFDTIQLALKKAFVDIGDNWDFLTTNYTKKVVNVFEAYHVNISVLGCYLNYAYPDIPIREENINIFKKHLEVANILNCKLVGTETGSLNNDYSFNADNHKDSALNIFAKSLEQMIEKAESDNAYIGIEGVAKHIIHTPERMEQILKLLPSNHLRVIFDPVNYITIDNYKNQEKIIYSSFEKFAEKIDVIHTKDFKVENGRIIIVPPGEGFLDYKLLSRLIKELNQTVDILIENVKSEEMIKSKDFINYLIMDN